MIRNIGVIAWFAVCAAALPARAGLDFFVKDDGSLSVLRNGSPVLVGETLLLLSADGTTVAQPLKTAVVRSGGRGGEVTASWSSDIGVVRRTVSRRPDGRIGIVWKMKFLNGVVEGRRIEFCCLMPKQAFDYPEDGNPDLELSEKEMLLDVGDGMLRCEFGTPPAPWRFQDMRDSMLHGNFRLRLEWPYNPAMINEIEFSITIGEEEKKGK